MWPGGEVRKAKQVANGASKQVANGASKRWGRTMRKDGSDSVRPLGAGAGLTDDAV